MRIVIVLAMLFACGCVHKTKSEKRLPPPVLPFDVTRMVEEPRDAYPWCFPPNAKAPQEALDQPTTLAFQRIHQALVADSVFPPVQENEDTNDELMPTHDVRPDGSALPELSILFREVVQYARERGTPVFVSSDQAVTLPSGSPSFVRFALPDYEAKIHTTPGAYFYLITHGIVRHQGKLGFRIEFARDYHRLADLAAGALCFVPQADGSLHYSIGALIIQ